MTVLRGGLLVDGTGAPTRPADVVMRGPAHPGRRDLRAPVAPGRYQAP